MMLFVLLLVSLIVGFLCGSTGVGGIILVPALTLLAGMDTHTAMATSLASFVFLTVQIGWLYYRRGLLELSVVWPLLAGGTLAGFLGAMVKSWLMAPSLNIILALLILLAAVNILQPARQGAFSFATARLPVRNGFLFALGAFVGFSAGLTGAGGAIISIPVMVFFGFSPLCSIAAGQAFSVGSAISGTVGNLLYGSIDVPMVALITLGQMAGVVAGVRMACRVPTKVLRLGVACTCIGVAGILLVQSIVRVMG